MVALCKENCRDPRNVLKSRSVHWLEAPQRRITIVLYYSEVTTCQLKVTPQLKQNKEWSWCYNVPFKKKNLLNNYFEGKLLLRKCPNCSLFSCFNSLGHLMLGRPVSLLTGSSYWKSLHCYELLLELLKSSLIHNLWWSRGDVRWWHEDVLYILHI